MNIELSTKRIMITSRSYNVKITISVKFSVIGRLANFHNRKKVACVSRATTILKASRPISTQGLTRSVIDLTPARGRAIAVTRLGSRATVACLLAYCLMPTDQYFKSLIPHSIRHLRLNIRARPWDHRTALTLIPSSLCKR